MRTQFIDHQQLVRFSTDLFVAVGVPPADAEFTATTLVEAELRGIYSHGVIRLQSIYLEDLAQGRTNPRPKIKVVTEGPSYALLDGDRGLGQVVAKLATESAIAKAAAAAVGVVGVRNATHFGAAAYWPVMAAERGMIGFACSNGPGVNTVPYGGVEPAQGNLPLAWAIPAGDEFPIVLDMATGVAAMGKVAMAALRGEAIPLGWGVDKEGEDTTDPNKVTAILPAAGPKGYALGVVIDSLAGSLTGGLPSILKLQSGAPPDSIGSSGLFFLAIDVQAFIPLEAFRRTVDVHSQLMRKIKPRKGVDRIYMPGEIEWLNKQRRLAEGIPVREEEMGVLTKMGSDYGVVAPWIAEGTR